MNAFWASIIVGTAFGFVGSILANFIHNPLLALLDRWRVSSRRKRFAREEQFQQFLSDLKTGKIDKYIFLIRICATMVMGFLGMLICTAIGILLSYITDRPDAFPVEVFFGLSAGFFRSFYVVAAARFQAVSYGLANFDKLRTEFNDNWAEHLDGIEPPSPAN
jgi:hypothetical protein